MVLTEPSLIRRLREMGLLEKKDIQKLDLLFECNPELIEILTDWDPGALKAKSKRYRGYVHHDTIKQYAFNVSEHPEDLKSDLLYQFQPLIKAGFRHYPDQLGLLMLKDDEENTVWKKLNEQIGPEETWKVIKDSIHETGNANMFMESTDKNPNVSFAPLFAAAAASDLTDDLNIVYHLLQEEPAQWLLYFEEPDSEPNSNPNSKRPRDEEISNNMPVPLAEQQEVSALNRVSQRSKVL